MLFLCSAASCGDKGCDTPIPDDRDHSLIVTSDDISLETHDSAAIAFECRPAAAVDEVGITDEDGKTPTDFSLCDVVSDATGYCGLIKDNGSPVEYSHSVRLRCVINGRTILSDPFIVKSSGYDRYLEESVTDTEQRVTATTAPQIVNSSISGGVIHISFEADEGWEVVATSDVADASWAKIEPLSGSAGLCEVCVTMPENTSDNDRNLTINICPVQTRNEDVDPLKCFRASMAGIGIIQYGLYRKERLTHVHLDAPETLAETLRKKFGMTDEQLTGHIRNLYINGAVGNRDFDYMRKTLKNLRILDMLNADTEEIPDGAFLDCKNLHYIVFPYKLRRIGRDAFLRCGLRNSNLIFPPYLRQIGDNAFCKTLVSGIAYFPLLTPIVDLGNSIFTDTLITALEFGEGIQIINSSKYSVLLTLFETTLAYVRLPSTLNQLNSYFFNRAKIGYVLCHAHKPPKTYEGVSSQGVLLLCVPIDCDVDYAKDSNWSTFAANGKLAAVLRP